MINIPTMEVLLNNQKYAIEEETSITKFLSQIDIVQTKGIAIAVNNMVVPKEQWENHILNNQDKIIIITATQGG